jgi:hypothetical protein
MVSSDPMREVLSQFGRRRRHADGDSQVPRTLEYDQV